MRLRLRRGGRRDRLQGHPGNITHPAEGNGIDGDPATWTPATFDLSSYAGKTVKLRLHYKTDPAAAGNGGAQTPGLFADDITDSAALRCSPRAPRPAPEGWTLAGFSSVGESVTTWYENY